MGLDLSVVKNLKFLGKEEDYNDDDIYNNSIFLYQNDLLFSQSDGLETGFYSGDYDKYVESVGWSYSGYGRWRTFLLNFIGYKDLGEVDSDLPAKIRDVKITKLIEDESIKIDIPFIEMCYFSDCEGFIGSETSKKLYKDFIDNKEKYNDYAKDKLGEGSEYEYYTHRYNNLTEYFRVASENNGAVIFS